MRAPAHLAHQALLLHLATELTQRLLELLLVLDDYLQPFTFFCGCLAGPEPPSREARTRIPASCAKRTSARLAPLTPGTPGVARLARLARGPAPRWYVGLVARSAARRSARRATRARASSAPPRAARAASSAQSAASPVNRPARQVPAAASPARSRSEAILLYLLLAIAVVGFGVAVFLTTVHYSGGGLACTTTSFVNCDAVTHSIYSTVWGTQIPITIPGMLWFLVSGALAAYARWGTAPRWLAPVHLLWAALAIVFALYLVYAEVVLVHELCEWCTAVHLLILATLLLTLRRVQLQAT
jgi:uncharacterized membrane protein